jgi:hypothetical protein
MPELYRIRVKRGDLEVEVESSDRDYVETKLEHYLSAQRSPGSPPADSPPGSSADFRGARSPLTVREFVKQVNPEKKNEVAATIAYFLEYHASPTVEEWRLEDVGDKFADARKPKPANMRDLLVKSDYFMDGREKSTYRLSEAGVKWVEGRLSNHEG